MFRSPVIRQPAGPVFATISGTDDPDNITGTEGADTILGNGGDDVLRGLGGADRINGHIGNDLLRGDDGDDNISGEIGNDTLLGGDGDDFLDSASNVGELNYVDGGAGADQIISGGTCTVRGGGGDDSITVVTAMISTGAVKGGGGTDTLIVGNNCLFTGDFDAAVEGFELLKVPTTLTASAAANLLDFSSVALVGGTGAGFLAGGGGDIVKATVGNDTVHGEGGADALYGMGGNDSLFGESGDDSMDGGDGDDTIVSGLGADSIRGGAGADRILLSDHAKADGEAGDDYIVTGDLTIAQDGLAAGSGADTLEVAANTVFAVFGFDAKGRGFDFLKPSSAISGDASANMLNFSGVDLIGAAGAAFFGQGGDDVIDATLGADTVHGGAGADILRGGLGADHLYGDEGLDTLSGEAGDDTLEAGSGANDLYGGAGDDLLVVSGASSALGGDGKDYVRLVKAKVAEEAVQGGAGTDTLEINDSVIFARAAFDAVQEGFEVLKPVRAINGFAGANLLDFSGVKLAFGFTGAVFFAGGGADTVHATIGADNVHGAAGKDRLFGETGNDTLFGEAANDRLDGGAGKDSLSGGDGDDILTGGSAADTLSGGLGRDRFTYLDVTDSGPAKAGRDSIAGFSHAEHDRIDLSALDAVTGGADDAFHLATKFHGIAGELVIKAAGSNAYTVSGDIDGDGAADFVIAVSSVTALAGADFVL